VRRGESILSAARAIDTSLVKARLERFERAHQDYADAHRKVEAAEGQLRMAEIRVETCDAVQDKAVAALAGALIADGQPYANAFAPFGALPISKLTRLLPRKEAEAAPAGERSGRAGPTSDMDVLCELSRPVPPTACGDEPGSTEASPCPRCR